MRQVSFAARAARWASVGALIVLIPLFVRAAAPAGIDARMEPLPRGAQANGEPAPAEELSFSGADATPFPVFADVPNAAEELSQAGVAQFGKSGAAEGYVDTGVTENAGGESAVIFSDGTFVQPETPPPLPQETDAPEGTWSYENSRVSVHIERHQKDNFTYYATDIQLTDPSQFSYAFSHEKYGASEEALSDIAARHDPLVAINGDYYSFHSNGIIIRGGELFRKNKSSRHLLVVDKNGDLRVNTDRSEKQSVVATQLMNEGVLHAFEFGPVLVENGEAVRLNSAILRVGEGYLEPRTAIGQLGPLHYLILVVDGRSKVSEGCDLPTLQKLFLEYGVSVAFNLDGGGSTTLWFDGRVINNPASGDERKVSDIVMFMR